MLYGVKEMKFKIAIILKMLAQKKANTTYKKDNNMSVHKKFQIHCLLIC